jgi:hypothetical protein
MRWTRERRKTSGADADGEIVWSWRPDAGAKFSWDAIPRERRGQKSPVPGEITYKLLKPLRGECRMYPVPPL